MCGDGTTSDSECGKHVVVPDFDPSLFVRRAFDVLDEDGRGCVRFREFVIGLWNYCTLDRSALLLFAFDMCDFDNTGNYGINGC